MKPPRLVLASGSRARTRLLQAAGLDFICQPARVDEDAIRQTLEAGGKMPAEDVASILAEAKAGFIAEQYPLDFVVGADQVLEFDGRIITKAHSREEARQTLIQLRGKIHRLISAVTVVRTGAVLWRHTEEAELEMRDFSNEFLGRYLAAMGDRVTETVGGYEIEGRGIQLFSRISGDIFTIQGLPLLPLLDFLRREDVIG